MTKCPYVPPHEFDLDFPHLMVRARAVAERAGKTGFFKRQFSETDRNGWLARHVAPLANWASARGNGLTRPLLETIAGVHRDAALPEFHRRTFTERARQAAPTVNRAAPAFGRKAVLYATCFTNYNNPRIGEAARAVLARNGVETEVVYPECCGMPHLEYGALDDVAAKARAVAAELAGWIEAGYDVIALVPSCALMLKFEWPLIEPGDADVVRLGQATYDVSEYIVDIARGAGLAGDLDAIDGGVVLHIACHARAQNMGQKAREMLALIPDIDLEVIERCSGHGGSWGVMKQNFEVALKVGRPVARAAAASGKTYIASECPLAGEHIIQGIQRLGDDAPDSGTSLHPIEIFARACGIET
jgi:glycerol-3-phosphate dehydrogenase subunit C